MTKPCDNISSTSGMPQTAIQNLREPFVGNLDIDLSEEMALTNTDLIKPNTKEASESLDSAASCVDWIERRKLKIGIRLNDTERKALEFAARERRMTLSDYVRASILNPKNEIAV